MYVYVNVGGKSCSDPLQLCYFFLQYNFNQVSNNVNVK